MRDTVDLLTETINTITHHGQSVEDVQWVEWNAGGGYSPAGPRQWATWDEFATKATGYTYDNGFGGQEIRGSLMVVGSDWWLERHEYDGSEWWEFKTKPTKPDIHNPDVRLKYYDF